MQDLAHDNPVHSALLDIHGAADRAATLTRQLLAFSRMQIMKYETLDLGTLVADMQPMLGRVVGENIDLLFKRGDDPCTVNADKSQIEQVVMNLVVNARDAMPDGGRLTLELRTVEVDVSHATSHPVVALGPYAVLSVSDTGIGMDEETRRQMFEPFFTTKDPGKGTVLGLATAYGIVQQSQGNIWAYSEPGHGTVVKVYLPWIKGAADPSPAVSDSAPSAPVSKQATTTVLVVEDEEGLRQLVEHVLTAAGYKVLAAANGDEALALSRRHDGPIHLLLTDVVLPGVGGPELADQLAVDRPQMKVLYTSGYTDDAVLRHSVANHSVQFIAKPWSIVDLRRKVRQVLDG